MKEIFKVVKKDKDGNIIDNQIGLFFDSASADSCKMRFQNRWQNIDKNIKFEVIKLERMHFLEE